MSNFNPLVPQFADRVWDELVPEFCEFRERLFHIRFTQDSTRTNIQPLDLWLTWYCCSTITNGECNSESNNPGSLRLLIEVQTRRSLAWTTAAVSTCYLNTNLNVVQCCERFQLNRCIGRYDSAIPDIDLVTQFLRWQALSQSVIGSFQSSIFYKYIVEEENPCEINTGPLSVGKNVLISLFNL